MNSLQELENKISSIIERNKKVELDKKWETSFTRKLSIFILTYFVIVIFFFVINLNKPFVNAVVPALGFLLSTLSLPMIRNWWIKKQK